MLLWNGSGEYYWRYRADTILFTDGQAGRRTDWRTWWNQYTLFQLRWSEGYGNLTLERHVIGTNLQYNFPRHYTASRHDLFFGTNITQTFCFSLLNRNTLEHFGHHHVHENTGLILGLHPANARRRYKVTPSLTGWAQSKNPPWNTSGTHRVTVIDFQCGIWLNQ